jgi:hypothetical protein
MAARRVALLCGLNPIVLGALIGAIPALLAGALSTWAAVRGGRVSLERTELTLRADHERWLREKRCDLYIEMIKFLRVRRTLPAGSAMRSTPRPSSSSLTPTYSRRLCGRHINDRLLVRHLGCAALGPLYEAFAGGPVVVDVSLRR